MNTFDLIFGAVIEVMPVSEHERLREAAAEVVRIWQSPPRVDSPTDLDSAIDDLTIVLSTTTPEGS